MRHVLFNEWRVTRRQPGLWLLLVAYALLLGYGSVQSVSRVVARQQQIAAARSDVEARWHALRTANQGPDVVWSDARSPSLVGGPAGFVFTWMAVDGLSVLSPGESARLPSLRRVSIYGSEQEPPLENPLAPAGGLFDLSFVVIWLLPLVLLAATHAVVSGDRQQGTWALVVSSTSSPARVIVARLAWPAVALSALTVGTGLTAAGLAGPIAADDAWRAAAWVGTVFAYVGFWTSLGGIVSMRSATAASALLRLGLVWVGLVWIVPGVIDASVSATQPAVDRVDILVAQRESQRDLEARLPALLDAVYARHPDWEPSPAAIAAATRPVPGGPASRDSRRVYVPALAAAEVTRPFARALVQRQEQVEQRVRSLSVLSPALAAQLISDHLARASAGHYVAFDRHVETAEQEWHAFFAPRIMQLRDLSREELGWVPRPAPFVARLNVSEIRWPLLGLVGSTVFAAGWLRRHLRHVAA